MGSTLWATVDDKCGDRDEELGEEPVEGQDEGIAIAYEDVCERRKGLCDHLTKLVCDNHALRVVHACMCVCVCVCVCVWRLTVGLAFLYSHPVFSSHAHALLSPRLLPRFSSLLFSSLLFSPFLSFLFSLHCTCAERPDQKDEGNQFESGQGTGPDSKRAGRRILAATMQPGPSHGATHRTVHKGATAQANHCFRSGPQL